MTGLELGEIQVGQAVLFVLGLAVGLAPLWREPYTRNTVSCFGKALFFWFSFFNTYHFAAGLEKAGVQKWQRGEVGDSPLAVGGEILCSPGPAAAVVPSSPVPLSRPPPAAPRLATTAGIPFLLTCRLGKSPPSLGSSGALSGHLTSSASSRGEGGGGWSSAPSDRPRLLPARSVPDRAPLSCRPRGSFPSAPSRPRRERQRPPARAQQSSPPFPPSF